MMAMNAVRQQAERLTVTQIVTMHQQVVYRYLLRFTRNPQDAQDLFQETFLRACRAYAALPAEANIRAWLMRIAINLTKNYVRDRLRHRRVIVESVDADSASRQPEGATQSTTEDIMLSRETAHTLLTTIDALPFRQRVAFVQHQFEGLDYPTIAANLACSQDSARAHVYQALRKLRLALEQSIPDGQGR